MGRFLDFFFPRFCVHCHQCLRSDTPGFICSQCFQSIVFNHGSSCPCCGCDQGETQAHLCDNCRELQPYFSKGISLFAFNGVGRQLIHTIKYHQGTYLKKDLLRIFERQKERFQELKHAYFIPVPLHFIRKWKRGFNQSEMIAQALAHYCQGFYQNILKRKVNTPSQTHLSRKERIQNVEKAFALKVKTIDPQQTYVLVDDVLTTGATLNACANVLHDAGAKDIRIFTLAHG